MKGQISRKGDDADTRINVNLSDAQYEELKRTAEAAGMDMSEFVRNSLRIFNHLQKEIKAGNSVYIGKDNKLEKELVMP